MALRGTNTYRLYHSNAINFSYENFLLLEGTVTYLKRWSLYVVAIDSFDLRQLTIVRTVKSVQTMNTCYKFIKWNQIELTHTNYDVLNQLRKAQKRRCVLGDIFIQVQYM